MSRYLPFVASSQLLLCLSLSSISIRHYRRVSTHPHSRRLTPFIVCVLGWPSKLYILLLSTDFVLTPAEECLGDSCPMLPNSSLVFGVFRPAVSGQLLVARRHHLKFPVPVSRYPLDEIHVLTWTSFEISPIVSFRRHMPTQQEVKSH